MSKSDQKTLNGLLQLYLPPIISFNSKYFDLYFKYLDLYASLFIYIIYIFFFFKRKWQHARRWDPKGRGLASRRAQSSRSDKQLNSGISIAICSSMPSGGSGPGPGMLPIPGWSKRLVATVRWSAVERMPHHRRWYARAAACRSKGAIVCVLASMSVDTIVRARWCHLPPVSQARTRKISIFIRPSHLRIGCLLIRHRS